MIDEVKKALVERRKSASWLAREIGVSRMSMSRWLRGVEALPAERAEQIADLLGIKRTNERSRSGAEKG